MTLYASRELSSVKLPKNWGKVDLMFFQYPLQHIVNDHYLDNTLHDQHEEVDSLFDWGINYIRWIEADHLRDKIRQGFSDDAMDYTMEMFEIMLEQAGY